MQFVSMTVRSRRKLRQDEGGVLKLDVGQVVIDTDAGSDDAVGILQTLGHENLHGGVKVIGITCVTGNTRVDNVVVNVLKTLDTVNRLDVIWSGFKMSLHQIRAFHECCTHFKIFYSYNKYACSKVKSFS